MQMFKIYLAGGMGNLTWEEQTLWRSLVKDIFNQHLKVKDHKYILDIIDPTQFYNFINKRHSDELEVMKYDLRHVKTSDLIIVNFNDPQSIGTAQELAVAYDRGIPIIGMSDNKVLHPWLKCNCDKIFDNYLNMVDYIIEFYLA